MAEVPEINDIIMDSYSGNKEELYADYSCEIKTNMKHLEWNSCHTSWSTCRSGIKPEIRKPGKALHTFKKAILLAVVVENLKGRKGFDKQCFFDDNDLLNHILVEEVISFNEIEETSAAPPKFRYSKTTVHIIRDSRQKSLILPEFQGNTHLVALFLQGGNSEQEAKINMGSYIAAPFDGQKLPVTLSIAGRNLFLSCIAEEGKKNTPALSLTEVANIKEKKDNDLLPFLFYKTTNGNNNSTFESAAFTGWYISTSQQQRQSVQMKPQDDQVFIRDFLFY